MFGVTTRLGVLTLVWRFATPAVLTLFLLTAAAPAFAGPPVLEDAWVDTYEDTLADVFPDSYLISGDEDLDYDSFEVDEPALHGIVLTDDYPGAITYIPDSGYSGFDAFSYTVKDELGRISNVAWVYLYVEPDGSVTNLAPLIVNFQVVNDAQVLTFTGQVLDENPETMTIQFGESMDGHYANVSPSGYFYLQVYATPQMRGLATAITQDEYNIYSNEAMTFVDLP